MSYLYGGGGGGGGGGSGGGGGGGSGGVFNVGGGGDEPPRRPPKPSRRRDSIPQGKADAKEKEKESMENFQKSKYTAWLLNTLIARYRSGKLKLKKEVVEQIARILSTDDNLTMEEIGEYEQLITGESFPVGSALKHLRQREVGGKGVLKTESKTQKETRMWDERQKAMEKRIKALDLAEHVPEHKEEEYEDEDDEDDEGGEGMQALGRIAGNMHLAGGGYKHGGIVKGKKGQAVPIVAHAGELVVPVKAVAKVLKSSAWIDHVKAVQKAHGISYKDAMTMAKGSYKK